MHFSHGHGQAQRNLNPVQRSHFRIRLLQQGTQKLAVDDFNQGGRHIERSETDERGRTVAGPATYGTAKFSIFLFHSFLQKKK